MSEHNQPVARAIGGGEVLRFGQLLEAPLRWPKPSRLRKPTTALNGLGPATAATFEAELGIDTIESLLLHLPRQYRQAPPLVVMSDLVPGREATVAGEVGTVGRYESNGPARRGRRPGRLTVTLRDLGGRGAIKAIWFNQPWLAEQIKPGMTLRLTGTLDRHGFVVAAHEIVENEETTDGEGLDLAREFGRLPWREGAAPAAVHTRDPVPVHPASERVSARQLRRFIWQALAECENRPAALPARLRIRRGYPGTADALRAVHFPALSGPGADAKALESLAFEELLLHQLALLRRRRQRRRLAGHRLTPPGRLYTGWLDRLPFTLTADQSRAIAEIGADLEAGRPMQRLLMGEVGSGKTVVALAAMMRAVEAGSQATIMAPTEVLAEQHAETINHLLAGTGLECGLLTGSTPQGRRRELLAELAAGRRKLIAGTHALLEEPVRFADLALSVIDEQHRFGVRQRQLLDRKGREGMRPHLLHMSATPIPRTLSLLAYGDLDVSELRNLPADRRPIETQLVEADERPAAFEALRESLRQGRQAYVICPLVTESEALQAKAALVEAERLARGELSGFKIAVLHGRMSAAEKRETMAAFAAGESDVLVATTVIEVGIDVANATTIVIEGAERFGLAQLHQLRGRVGRGRHSSRCLLMPGELGANARRRLEAVVAHPDGFDLAELDLRLRGAGELLGDRQHGLPGFKAARLPEHADLLREAGQLAHEVLNREDALGDDELLFRLAEERFGSVSPEVIAA